MQGKTTQRLITFVTRRLSAAGNPQNPAVKLLLRSPLHGLLSKDIILVTFTGRKSGRRYTTPVSYVEEGDKITFLTQGRWWKNLRGNDEACVPVTVRVRGRDLEARAQVVADDKDAIAAGIREVLTQVPRDAGFYGVSLAADGEPSSDDALRAARHTVVVRLYTKC